MTSTPRVYRAHSGNAHFLNEDGKLVCGTPKPKGVEVRNLRSDPNNYVTCSKCRKIHGLYTIAGSYRSRGSVGLDSSAWGANKGR